MDVTPHTKTASENSTSRQGIRQMFEGSHLQFPVFRHENHPAVIDVNKVADERFTLGQRIADRVASTMGSWNFIIAQAMLMVVWVSLNSVAWFLHFDGYPYILLNLAMSAQAAFATPLIMMSQNRQAEKDRLTAQNDYLTDCKGEEEIRHIMEHLDHQDTLILQLLDRLDMQHREILHQMNKPDAEPEQNSIREHDGLNEQAPE
jgi:uncharacterized membrane protein